MKKQATPANDCYTAAEQELGITIGLRPPVEPVRYSAWKVDSNHPDPVIQFAFAPEKGIETWILGPTSYTALNDGHEAESLHSAMTSVGYVLHSVLQINGWEVTLYQCQNPHAFYYTGDIGLFCVYWKTKHWECTLTGAISVGVVQAFVAGIKAEGWESEQYQ